MLIDTHCHLNILIKKNFDTLLTNTEIEDAKEFINLAGKVNVTKIINVGTSVEESLNCIALAQRYINLWATVGIHPNDLKPNWQAQFDAIKSMVKNKEENKICGIGEIGMDNHYPNSDLSLQSNALKRQIELALENDLAIVIHTRDAADETLRAIEPFARDITKGIIHCFSEDLNFAKQVIDWGFAIGLGGTITYPKNNNLRLVAQEVNLDYIVLETDTPFLPPQEIRGQKNTPAQIKTIASYLAELKNCTLEEVANKTTANAERIFKL